MALLNPYLQFDGTARQAMEHYREVFGGDLDVRTFGEYGATGDGPPADGVMHAQLTTDLGFTIMGSDLPPEWGPARNGSVCVSGAEEDILRGYFEQLAVGGTVETALERQMWGDVYGQLTDRFGITWMVNIAGDAVE